LFEKAQNIVGLMRSSVARMSGLINNLLDFARGRLGGGLPLARNADAALEPALNQVVSELRQSAPDRTIETQFALGEPVNCDRARVAQLFSNLLGNALAYGVADKPIRVRAQTAGGVFELSVANAGDPIPPAAVEKLFQPFSRGAVRPNQQGLGLGLYIAAEIARAHDGTIEVASSAEETRFTFRMPVGDSARSTTKA
jgi:signal transduction histidine kinase